MINYFNPKPFSFNMLLWTVLCMNSQFPVEKVLQPPNLSFSYIVAHKFQITAYEVPKLRTSFSHLIIWIRCLEKKFSKHIIKKGKAEIKIHRELKMITRIWRTLSLIRHPNRYIWPTPKVNRSNNKGHRTTWYYKERRTWIIS